MKQRQAILCDFDGTLFDLALDLRSWWQWVERRTPADASIVPRTVETALIALPPRHRDEARNRLQAAEEAAVRAGEPRPGAAEFLKRICGRWSVAIVTSNYSETVRAGLQALAMTTDVPVIAREDVDRPKPDPEPVLLALDRLVSAAHSAVLIGDSSHDVEAARAAGVASWIVHNPRLPRPPTDGDLSVDHLFDLLPRLGCPP